MSEFHPETRPLSCASSHTFLCCHCYAAVLAACRVMFQHYGEILVTAKYVYIMKETNHHNMHFRPLRKFSGKEKCLMVGVCLGLSFLLKFRMDRLTQTPNDSHTSSFQAVSPKMAGVAFLAELVSLFESRQDATTTHKRRAVLSALQFYGGEQDKRPHRIQTKDSTLSSNIQESALTIVSHLLGLQDLKGAGRLMCRWGWLMSMLPCKHRNQ